jgi:hypothetical protein
MTIATLGLDLGKMWIFLVGLDDHGRIVLQRRIRRTRMTMLTAACRGVWSGWRRAAARTSSAAPWRRKGTMCG